MTWGSNLAWELENRKDFFRGTCLDVPLYYTIKDAHHYITHTPGSRVRLIRNVGCGYVQPVHEYLVWPGEEKPKDIDVIMEHPDRRPDWYSISELPRLQAYGQIPFFEHTFRKSDKALRAKARRYKRFAGQSTRAGIYMDGDEDCFVKERGRVLRNGLYAPLPKGRDVFVVEVRQAGCVNRMGGVLVLSNELRCGILV